MPKKKDLIDLYRDFATPSHLRHLPIYTRNKIAGQQRVNKMKKNSQDIRYFSKQDFHKYSGIIIPSLESAGYRPIKYSADYNNALAMQKNDEQLVIMLVPAVSKLQANNLVSKIRDQAKYYTGSAKLALVQINPKPRLDAVTYEQSMGYFGSEKTQGIESMVIPNDVEAEIIKNLPEKRLNAIRGDKLLLDTYTSHPETSLYAQISSQEVNTPAKVQANNDKGLFYLL